MVLVVLLVHIETVDPALLFHLLELEVPKDLLRNKGRNQLPYLCCFHTLKLLPGPLSIVSSTKVISFFSPSQHIKMRISLL